MIICEICGQQKNTVVNKKNICGQQSKYIIINKQKIRKGKKMKTLRMIIKKIAMLWKESSEMMYKDAQYRMFV